MYFGKEYVVARVVGENHFTYFLLKIERISYANTEFTHKMLSNAQFYTSSTVYVCKI
jgi:hypothetical protein